MKVFAPSKHFQAIPFTFTFESATELNSFIKFLGGQNKQLVDMATDDLAEKVEREFFDRAIALDVICNIYNVISDYEVKS